MKSLELAQVLKNNPKCAVCRASYLAPLVGKKTLEDKKIPLIVLLALVSGKGEFHVSPKSVDNPIG